MTNQEKVIQHLVTFADANNINTYIDAMPNPVEQEELVTISITVKDAYKNHLVGGGDTVMANVSGANTETITATDNSDGTYTATYTPMNSGEDTVTGTINDDAIGSDGDGTSDGSLVVTVSTLPPPPPPPPPPPITFDFSKLDIDFDDDYVSGKHRALEKKVKVNFENTEGIAYYKASTYSRFVGKTWQPISDSPKLKISSGNQKNGKKQRFYFKFKSENGVESEVYSKYVYYQPKEKRSIKQSSSKVRRGELLIQKGKRFKKKKEVDLYFSRPMGGYYPPMRVKTDKSGRFEVHYIVNKPVGTYKWYAQQVSTGKKSDIKEYKIVN